MQRDINIRNLFANKDFQALQDSISVAVGLAIIVVDYLGKPVTKHSSCTDFCNIIRSNTVCKDLCERCDSRAGLEAARTQSPYIYLCHANIVDLAIPIIYDNTYLGSFMAGQVLFKDSSEVTKLEKIYTSKAPLNQQNLLEAYKNLPIITFKKLQSIAVMLSSICSMYLENALVYDTKNQPLYEPHPQFAPLSLETTEAAVPTGTNKNYKLLLRPAFEYINQNLTGDLSQKKVAAICNMSTNYFSRVFSKQMSMHFTDFINHKKVDYSKTLLNSTDMPIHEISSKLNFCECSYYIKVFKQFVHMTPSAYRKLFIPANNDDTPGEIT